ncbi:unnamed protein product [Blepharisma stoltei]|uniref:mRNA m(6)A methyltransferase n=1 Tax=Blepharisma stoltei TaxID=1481888 RepID=A0AAU9J2R2_9CILI|nr:unnamed protein product [Blepharisma stoltei]
MVKKRTVKSKQSKTYIPSSQESETYADSYNNGIIQEDLEQIDKYIYQEEMNFFKQEFDKREIEKTSVPEDSIPICADVRNYDFLQLAKIHQEVKGKLFDVIMMDPPWQLSGANPTRGVTISYESLPDPSIRQLPIPKLQNQGLIFIWTINAKYRMSLQLLDCWGYKYVDEVVWVKKTCNNKIAKSHGYWLQHAKETCLVGVKGDLDMSDKEIPDIIFSLRRGQSQKPEEVYQMIEELVPNGSYLEIFGRRNNLRAGWITIGNEI